MCSTIRQIKQRSSVVLLGTAISIQAVSSKIKSETAMDLGFFTFQGQSWWRKPMRCWPLDQQCGQRGSRLGPFL